MILSRWFVSISSRKLHHYWHVHLTVKVGVRYPGSFKQEMLSCYPFQYHSYSLMSSERCVHCIRIKVPEGLLEIPSEATTYLEKEGHIRAGCFFNVELSCVWYRFHSFFRRNYITCPSIEERVLFAVNGSFPFQSEACLWEGMGQSWVDAF